MPHSVDRGDIVQLCSGGPHMAVNVRTEHQATCIWYSEHTGDFKTYTFPVVLLKLVSAAEPDVAASTRDARKTEEDTGEPAVKSDWCV